MNILLILIVLLLLFGGGGFYFGGPAIGGTTGYSDWSDSVSHMSL